MGRACGECNGVGFVDLNAAEPTGCPECNPEGKGRYMPPPREEPTRTVTWVDEVGRTDADSTPEREIRIPNILNEGRPRPSSE
jgi:hypothetical protein